MNHPTDKHTRTLPIWALITISLMVGLIVVIVTDSLSIFSSPVYAQSGGISGLVWNDANTNGVIDPGESGVNGVTIVLYNGSSCQSVQTSGGGVYQFTGLADGSYRIYEAAGESTPTPVTCPPTETVADANTHVVTPGTIADPATYASSTANRIDVTITGGASLPAQNFGDYTSPPFLACPADAFLYQKKPTDFYGVSLVLGASFIIRDDWTITTNGVGFNLLDNYIYGYVTGSNGQISRTDGNGNIFTLNVQGLGKVNAYVGDVSIDGYLYLNRGKEAT